MPAKGQVIPLSKRFWEKVKKAGPNDCWIWCGTKNHKGYGLVKGDDRKNISTHRAAYSLCFGVIPDGMHVLHCCDNPACVNPAHLFLGTNLDNMRDRSRKGRTPKGEGSGRARLSMSQVKEIRERYQTKGETQDALARIYGVARNTVWCIVRNKTWRGI